MHAHTNPNAAHPSQHKLSAAPQQTTSTRSSVAFESRCASSSTRRDAHTSSETTDSAGCCSEAIAPQSHINTNKRNSLRSPWPPTPPCEPSFLLAVLRSLHGSRAGFISFTSLSTSSNTERTRAAKMQTTSSQPAHRDVRVPVLVN